MNYFSEMKIQLLAKSEQTVKAELFAKKVETEEGRQAVKLKIEVNPHPVYKETGAPGEIRSK